jgi:hypothetical protein
MRIVSTFIIIATFASVSSARGQTVHTKVTAGTVAAIAPPPAAPVVRNIPHPGRFFSGQVPIAVLSDGRVFADFGRGYEQIVRNCGNTTTDRATQPAVSQPTVTQPGVTQASAPALSPSVGDQSCWSADAGGQVLLTRP